MERYIHDTDGFAFESLLWDNRCTFNYVNRVSFLLIFCHIFCNRRQLSGCDVTTYFMLGRVKCYSEIAVIYVSR